MLAILQDGAPIPPPYQDSTPSNTESFIVFMFLWIVGWILIVSFFKRKEKL